MGRGQHPHDLVRGLRARERTTGRNRRRRREPAERLRRHDLRADRQTGDGGATPVGANPYSEKAPMAVSDTLINTLFDGRYRILRKLGTGGMANVYLAEDEVLGRRVAIKILNDRHAGDDQFVERFRREAKNAASLSHPNIVSIYDRGEAEGTYYIAMEYLDGRSLKELIVARGPAPIHLAVDYARQILAALRSPPPRHRPPRHQAAQRARRRRGTIEGDGLRDRARRREPDDGGGLDHRDGAVPVAGAGEGRRSTRPRTSIPSAWCSTSCSPASCLSAATRRSRSR